MTTDTSRIDALYCTGCGTKLGWTALIRSITLCGGCRLATATPRRRRR